MKRSRKDGLRRNGKNAGARMESYHSRLMVSFCTVFLIALLITCILFAAMMFCNARQNYEIYAENKTEDEIREMDSLFDSLRASFQYLEYTPAVNEFLYQNTDNYLAVSQTDLVAKQFKNSQVYLDSVHFYNQYNGKKISVGNVNSDREQFFADEMEAPEYAGTLNLVYSNIRGNPSALPERTLSILFQGDEEKTAKGHSAVVMTLDRNEIEKKILNNVEGIALVTDKAGNVIFQTAGTQRILSAADFCDLERLRALTGQQEGILKVWGVYEKKPVLLTMGSSSVTGLFIININYLQNLQGDIIRGILMICIVSLSAMLLFVMISYILSGRLYSPIKKVVHLVEDSAYGGRGGESADVVAALYDSVKNALTDIDMLESQKEAKRNMEKGNQLRRLLTGRSMDLTVFDEADLIVGVSNLFVICIRIDAYNTFSPDDRTAYEKTICSMIPELLEQTALCQAVDMAEGEIAVLFQFRYKDQNSFEELLEGMKEIQKSFLEILHFSITIGIGGAANTLEECAHYYERAQDMANYRFLYGWGRIFYPHLIEDLADTGGVYPIEMEQKLMKAVRNNSRGEFEIVMDDLIALIRSYTYPKVSAILVQLIAECIKTMNGITQNENLKYDLGIADLSTMFRSRELIENVKEWMLTLFDEYAQVLTRIHKMKDERYYNMVECAQAYIRENYPDFDLNVEAIARQCGYSSYYFSRMFKELTGMTPVDYIRQIRIAEAKRILTEDDEKISDIGQRIGYGNASNFYATFKKMVGMTPTEYREWIHNK